MRMIVLCTSVLYACAPETSFKHTEIKEDVCSSYKESLRISKDDYELLAKDYNDLRKTYEEEVNNLDNMSRRIRDLKLDKDTEKYILEGDK